MADFFAPNNTPETALSLGTLAFPGNSFEGRTTARIFDFDTVGRDWPEPFTFTLDILDHFTFDPYQLASVRVNFSADSVGDFTNELVFFPLSGVSKVTGAVVGTWSSGDHSESTQAREFLADQARGTRDFLRPDGLNLGIDFTEVIWEDNPAGGADSVWILNGDPVVFRAFGLQGDGTQEEIDAGGSIPVEVDYSFSILPQQGLVDEPEPEPEPEEISKLFVNDFFAAETLVGGEAVDTFDAGGDRDEFSIEQLEDGRIVVTDSVFPESPDTLIDVERIAFLDGNLAFDTEGNAGQAYRLYQAAFDREPDAEGLGFWIDNYDLATVDLLQMAEFFMQSEEFAQRYGAPDTLSDFDFLTLLYANVLDRTPDQAGFDFWQDQQANGVSRGIMLRQFSESDENFANVSIAIQDGIFYL